MTTTRRPASRVTRPLVTIVTAAHRTRPQLLRDTLASAIQQTRGDFELVVSDDSPDDALGAVVEAFGDPRLRYVHNDVALGVACNHWTRFREAAGEYIAILNHDDVLEPTFLESLVAPLEADQTLALAFCDHYVIDGNGAILEAETEATSVKWNRTTLAEGIHRPFDRLLLLQTIPMAMGAVFRRNVLPADLPPDAGPSYDLWLTYLICRSRLGAFYVPERLSRWRTHENNLTSRAGADWALGAATCWAAIARDPVMHSIGEAARARSAALYYTAARSSWRAGDREKAATFARQSVAERPTLRGVLARLVSTGAVWAAREHRS